MIRNFSDHAANERTFLAWVRTAIAVMAFGFLIEKFDLFIALADPALVSKLIALPTQRFGNIVGLSLIGLGTAMVAVAAVRFLRTAKAIASEELYASTGARIDIGLAILMILVSGSLFIYLSHAILTSL